mmetsp:Transcript_17350/g.33880  ORF Transcript_17350/g.33880 Transcript_17350/m.33880 type:complete len:235 (-) Transcript_17350:261-965(-)
MFRQHCLDGWLCCICNPIQKSREDDRQVKATIVPNWLGQALFRRHIGIVLSLTPNCFAHLCRKQWEDEDTRMGFFNACGAVPSHKKATCEAACRWHLRDGQPTHHTLPSLLLEGFARSHSWIQGRIPFLNVPGICRSRFSPALLLSSPNPFLKLPLSVSPCLVDLFSGSDVSGRPELCRNSFQLSSLWAWLQQSKCLATFIQRCNIKAVSHIQFGTSLEQAAYSIFIQFLNSQV